MNSGDCSAHSQLAAGGSRNMDLLLQLAMNLLFAPCQENVRKEKRLRSWNQLRRKHNSSTNGQQVPRYLVLWTTAQRRTATTEQMFTVMRKQQQLGTSSWQKGLSSMEQVLLCCPSHCSPKSPPPNVGPGVLQEHIWKPAMGRETGENCPTPLCSQKYAGQKPVRQLPMRMLAIPPSHCSTECLGTSGVAATRYLAAGG